MASVLLNFLLFFCLILLYAGLVIYIERKVAAFVQARLGPYEVGPYGLLQSLADVIKLMQKEEIIPRGAHKRLMQLAPPAVFLPVFISFALLPVFPLAGLHYAETGALLLTGLLSLHVVGIFIAGWSTGNKFSLYGTFRAASQLLSYEIPLGLCIVCVVLVTGTLNLRTIAEQQAPRFHETVPLLGFLPPVNTSAWGGFFTWNIGRMPLLLPVFFVFFLSTLAQANRTPFDLPEAESELVGGYHTEYSGLGWMLFMMAEYAVMLVLFLLAVFLFLGGGWSPLPNIGAMRLADWTNNTSFWHFFWLSGKTTVLILSAMWIRWTYPRLRTDQLMAFCWKFLVPAAIILLYLIGVWCTLIAP